MDVVKRRNFVKGAAVGGIAALAGCSFGDGSGNDQQTEEDQEEAVRYFFRDETGAIGHLADQGEPGENEEVITNTDTEQEYQEKLLNDTAYAEKAISGDYQPHQYGLDTSIQEIVSLTEEIYNNPEQNFTLAEDEGINLSEEDDEIIFTRALIRATQEEGVNSSGLADWMVNNIAEHAIQEIGLDFNNYKISTLRATEPISPSSSHIEKSIREAKIEGEDFTVGFGGSGLRHMIGLLQYEKQGNTEIKYSELTDAISVGIFKHMIREPGDSLYRSSLEQDMVSVLKDSNPNQVDNAWPEHYVTAFDYEKARELESQDLLGMRMTRADIQEGVGDFLIDGMIATVDDIGPTDWFEENPDLNYEEQEYASTRSDGVISDSFGESIENYVTNPTPEKRQQFRNVSRGLYNLYNQTSWDNVIAIDGTLENPEILNTEIETINQIRQDQAYDQITQRVTAS